MRMLKSPVLLGAAAALAFSGLAGSVSAQTKSVMSECSAMYKADKAKGKLKEGMTWPKYFGECSKKMKPAAATAKSKAKKNSAKAPSAAALSKPLATKDKNGKPFTPGQLAAHKRMRECGRMWHRDKAAGKIRSGVTWPKYWSACNAKLKK